MKSVLVVTVVLHETEREYADELVERLKTTLERDEVAGIVEQQLIKLP